MNYIVFDLEWNQCPYGKDRENRKLPFEIIEIGAVKLNEKREWLDTFHALIRPRVYPRLHHQISRVVGLTIEDLRQGEAFPDAAAAFLDWCGEDPKFCTWGTLDLTELQRNLDFYRMGERLPGPVLYEDVQKLFAFETGEKKTRRSLEYAVDFLKLPDEGAFHLALDDAVYTARIFQWLSEENIRAHYSIDCFRNPKSKKEEIYLRYDTYEKYISREFASREAVMNSRDVTSLHCFCCGKNVRRKVHWFADGGGHNHLAVGFCPDHGLVKSKVRVREAVSGNFFAIRTTRMVSAEEAEKIQIKKKYIREKRENRRGRL